MQIGVQLPVPAPALRAQRRLAQLGELDRHRAAGLQALQSPVGQFRFDGQAGEVQLQLARGEIGAAGQAGQGEPRACFESYTGSLLAGLAAEPKVGVQPLQGHVGELQRGAFKLQSGLGETHGVGRGGIEGQACSQRGGAVAPGRQLQL